MFMYMGTLCKVIQVFKVPMYSVSNPSDLVARMLPANAFAAPSIASSMSHMALVLPANTLVPRLKLLRDSSITSLLTPTSFLVLTSVVSREIVLVLIAPQQTAQQLTHCLK